MERQTTKYHGFEFNDCGVCMNPDVPVDVVVKGNGFYGYNFKVKTAETKKGWVFGYDYNFGSGGGGCGAFCRGKGFPTEKAAIFDALVSLRKMCGGISDKKYRKLTIQAIDREINKRDVRQLELFPGFF